MSFPGVAQTIHQAIHHHVFSGLQVAIGQGLKGLYAGSYGTLDPKSPDRIVTDESLFDIASLTKPICTTTLMMWAWQEGLLKLDDNVAKFLPGFDKQKDITLRLLLSHQSGLPAWIPFYESVIDQSLNEREAREYFIKTISGLSLECQPGSRRNYSDLGFILLGFILETVTKTSLDLLFERQIRKPLKFDRLCFLPLNKGFNSNEIASTKPSHLKRLRLAGEVHDDNTHVLGGVAGHAGLFANVSSLEKFIHFLIRSFKEEGTWLKQETLKEFINFEDAEILGWDTVSPAGSQAGKYFSQKSIGHLAFTGCSLWLDLQDLKYIILLNNRVYFGLDDQKIKSFRPAFYDQLIQEAGLNK